MTEDRLVLWLWLHEVLGACNARFKKLLSEYEYIEELYARRETAQMALTLTPGEYKNARTRTLDSARHTLERCRKEGVRVLCYTDEDYPERLRATHYPPALLFVTGDPAALDRPLAVAGVGARFSTRYGRDAVHHICDPLAKAGVTLVSGMAFGIDSEVHRAALDNGGPTVAVLGTAIDDTYPAQNAGLRREIEDSGGAVVSEYAPGAQNHRGMFPQRNRIISGLSRAVVIFEAAKKSGTMITATWALEDGREVFAVPGSILSPHSEGTNHLIKQGAPPALSALDILEALDFHDLYVHSEKAMPQPQAPLSARQRQIREVMLRDGELGVDDLADATQLAPHVLLAELTEMEIDGVVEARAGGRYALQNA